MMRLSRHSVAAALALALAAAPAAAQPADPVASLREAFQAVGCVMNQDNQDRVLAESGLTAQSATDVVGALFASGELVAEGETIRLVSGECAGVGGAAPDRAALDARRMQVAAALASRGCRVSERETSALGGELGLQDAELVAALFELVGRGEARLERDSGTEIIILTAPPCDTPLARSLPLRVVLAIQDNGCAMSEAEAEALLSPLGTQDAVRAAVAPMFEANAVALGGPGAAFVMLNQAMCTADVATAEALLAGLDAVANLRPEQRPPFRAAPLAATVMVARALRADGCADARDAVERLVFATHLPNPPAVLAGWLASGFLTDQGDRIALGADWCALADADLPAALAAVLPAAQPTK
jgi:hypothetical protein